jgi:hypothetical protein
MEKKHFTCWIFQCRDRMRSLERPFVVLLCRCSSSGGQLIEQCRSSSVCKLLECDLLERASATPQAQSWSCFRAPCSACSLAGWFLYEKIFWLHVGRPHTCFLPSWFNIRPIYMSFAKELYKILCLHPWRWRRSGIICEDVPDANTLHIGQDLVVMVILNITDGQGGLTLVRSYSTKNAL